MDEDDTEALLKSLAEFIEYDDHRGLKFKKLIYDDVLFVSEELPFEDLEPTPVQKPMKRKPTAREVQARPCPIPTSKGKKCPNYCDHFRPACHVHDPDGKNAKALGSKYRKKMLAHLERLGIENKWG